MIPRDMIQPQTYRAEADRALATQLMLHPSVRPILLKLAERERALGTRRSLLAQALRLTPEVAPRLTGVLEDCRQHLGVETEIELYVYASPQFNAACTAPEGGRTFVLMSSSLVEAFADDELSFVIGHELGHHVFDHHAIPVGLLIHPAHRLPAPVILKLLSWQRYAEISSDRTGLVCCGGLDPAARALFKLSSGLSKSPNADQIAAYLAQAEDLYAEAEEAKGDARNHADWMSSHPFSPVRLSAAKAFVGSEILTEGGMSLPQVEIAVQGFLGLMEASYLEEDSAEAESMRRVLFAAGMILADADGTIHPDETEYLVSLLGRRRVPDKIDVDALKKDLPKRIARCNEIVRPARRAQVIRDLTGLARADFEVDEAEQILLIGWARELGVHECVVHENLHAPLVLD